MFRILESKTRPELVFIGMIALGGALFASVVIYAMVYMR